MIRLIAMGNNLMGDDGVALRVAERLEDQLRKLGVSVWTIETDPFCCLDNIREEDQLILIDAMEGLADHQSPGSILVVSLQEAVENCNQTASSHEISLLALLKIFGYQNDGYLLGILVPDGNLRCPNLELSRSVETALPKICRSTLEFVTSLIRNEYNKTVIRLEEGN